MTEKEILYFMNEAILEGRKALPRCLPNPPVGCVIVSDKRIISRGYTNEPGKHHAEAMALEAIKNPVNKDLSMFVILEPCSFEGKTPSCAKAIVRRGIRDIYVGILDPHPKNQGNGIEILKKGNLRVHMGVLKEKIHQELNDYLIRS